MRKKADAAPADLPKGALDSETNHLFSQVLSIASDAIIVVGPDHRIKIFNGGAEELFGYSAGEIIGQSIETLMPVRFAAGHSGQLDNYARSPVQSRLMGERSEVIGLKKDGSEFPAEASISKLETGDGMVFTAVLRDISERKAREVLLLDSRNKFRSLIMGFRFGVIVHQDGELVFINEAAATMHGYEVPEASGMKIVDFVAPDDLPKILQRAAARLQGETVPELYDYRALRKDGTTFPIQIIPQTIDWYGKPAILSALTDITEQKQTERDLKDAVAKSNEASRTKSEFLSNMSHEIRTPMNGVLGMAEILLDMDLAPKQKEIAQHLSDSGHTLLALLNDILDLAKIEAGKVDVERVDFSLEKLLDPVTALWKTPLERKGLELSVSVAPDVSPVLRSDPGRIGQILHNLIGNAAKFTEHGAVSLEVSQSHGEDGTLELRFAVTDTGVGIDAEAQEQLFGAFTQADSSTTRKYGGTGLGLAISKQLAELLGGSMGVESTPGKGSTFWFTIQCDAGNPDTALDRIHMPKFSTLDVTSSQRKA